MKERVKAIVKDLVGVMVILMAIGCCSASIADVDFDQKIHSINIPATNAASALNELAFQTGAVLLFPYQEAKAQQANAVVGDYTLKQAMAILLKDSGLVSSLTKDGAIKISVFGNQRLKKSEERTAMNTKKTLLAATIGFFMGSGVHGVVAQEDVGGQEENGWALEEIVVTATRREESLQDVAMAVSVFQPDEYTNAGLTSVADLIDYTPGVNFDKPGALPGGAAITIRGIGRLGGGISSVPTVGVYVDGIPLSSNSPWGLGDFFSFDGLLGDLERVEFLKGPQGTLYGSTSVGGAIRYITRKPSLNESSGLLSTSWSEAKEGGLNQLHNGRISIPVINDKIGITLAGFYEEDGGFVDHVDSDGTLINEDDDAFERFGISFDLYARLSDRMDFRGQFIKQERSFSGRPSVSLSMDGGSLMHGKPTTLLNYDFGDLSNTMYSATILYEFGFATLNSTTSFTESQFKSSADNFTPAVGDLLDVLFIDRPSGTTTQFLNVFNFGGDRYTQEFQLSSKEDEALEWMLGIYYTDEDTFREGIDTVQPGSFNLSTSSQPSAYEEIAVFGNATLSITDSLDFTAGFRVSDHEMSVNAVSTSDLGGGFSSELDSSAESTVDTYAFSLRYRPTNNVSLYARAASGYRPAFANPPIPNPFGVGTQEFVEADSLWSYELGAKSTLLDGRLSYDVALWRVDWSDVQAVVDVPASGQVRVNAPGGVTAQGIEGSILIELLDGLSIASNFAYTDSAINDDDPVIVALSGQQLPGVPKWTASVRVSYEKELTPEIEAALGVGVRYEDETRTAFSDNSTPIPGATALNIPTDAYSLVDADFSLMWNRTTFGIYATNLLDERAILNVNATAGLSDVSGTITRPRTIGARVSYNF